MREDQFVQEIEHIMELKSISQSGTGGSFNTAMLLTCDLPSSDK